MKNTASAAKEVYVVPVYLPGESGIYSLESPCHSHDEFRAFPKVLNYLDKKWVKISWSSDRNYVCYKEANNTQLAFMYDGFY